MFLQSFQKSREGICSDVRVKAMRRGTQSLRYNTEHTQVNRGAVWAQSSQRFQFTMGGSKAGQHDREARHTGSRGSREGKKGGEVSALHLVIGFFPVPTS